jgi:hypothetical protein
MNHSAIYKQIGNLKNNITTENIESDEDFAAVEKAIDKETKRRVALVPEAEHLGVMTACWIDGEFNVISNHEVSNSVERELKTVGEVK